VDNIEHELHDMKISTNKTEVIAREEKYIRRALIVIDDNIIGQTKRKLNI
jgi:hypothetical protein